MTNALETALAAYAPEIAARYSKMIKYGFENLVKEFGPAMNGVANSTSYKFWSGSIRWAVRNENQGQYNVAPKWVINEEKLEAGAKEYAEAAVVSFKAKIEGKMGELESAKVLSLGGGRFTITGVKGGKKVVIEQEIIVNQSSKGTLFNQFPARIYVEGKFISEAKFKKLFA